MDKEHQITRKIQPGESVASLARVVVEGWDGRKAIAWVEAVIRPNGRCQFILTTRADKADKLTRKTAGAAWLDR